MFTGLARQIIAPTGRAGIVVPTGIATDYTHRDFFADAVESGQLASLYDFENREGLFAGTHRSYKFSLLTLTGGGVPEAEFAFFLYSVDELADEGRRFTLTQADLALINPNTLTVPVFRTHRDAELTRKLHHGALVLVNEATGENPWGVSYSQGLFHSLNDSPVFVEVDANAPSVRHIKFQWYEADGTTILSLYDGRMIWFYDHRAASVEVSETAVLRRSISAKTTPGQHHDPHFVVKPRYWVPQNEVANRTTGLHPQGWFVAFKDVTAATNERTAVFTVIPWSGVSDRLGLLFFDTRIQVGLIACFVANVNSLLFDFAARQKVGGLHLKKYIIQQLPVLPPDRYIPELLDFIVPRVVELTYTAWDLQAFAQDILDEVGPDTWARWFADAPVHTSPSPEGQPATPAPFVWDEERRAHLRAELDGLYAHLYGLTRDELAYILDTFPIVRRKDEARYGEYRTKKMVLEAYDEC